LADDSNVYCPLCGNKVAAGLFNCPVCATDLSNVIARKAQKPGTEGFAEDYLRKELPVVELPIAERFCPQCGMNLQGNEVKCPRCSIPLVSDETLLECPECGALAPVDADVCPKCGVGFSQAPIVPGPPRAEPAHLPRPQLVKAPPVPQGPPMPRTVPATSPSVSAAGASYGLTNGRGAINGTGLINGTGITNGTRAGAGIPPGSERRRALATRWQFLSVLIVLVVVVSSFVYLSYASEQNTMTIDGRFNDWSHVSKFTMNTAATTSTINVDQWAVRTDASRLYLYLKVQGALMGSSNVDSFYLFVDSDNSAQTGYVVSGLGADYMLEIDGWNGSVQSTALSKYSSTSDQHNWTSWTNIGSLSTALASSQLEAMAVLSLSLGPDARYLLLSQNALNQQSISYVVPTDGGTLVIHQEAVSSSMPNGTVPYSSNLTLLKLGLLAEGAGGIVQSISPTVSGAELVGSLGPVNLKSGQEQTLEVMVDTSASAPGALVSVSVSKGGVQSDFTDVSIVGEPAKAYVVAPPSSIVIDGAFGDWVGRITVDTDSLPVLNPDIDINATGAVNTTQSSYFYVSVKGQMCNGSFVPTIKTKPTGGSGGGGLVIPTRITGEDLLRIYIDSDRNVSTGVPISMSSKVIGADYLVEIVGMDGVIDTRSLLVYQGGVWSLVPSVTLEAANDAQRIEIGVLSAAIGGSSSIDFIIETTDWRGRWDMATSLPQAYKGFSAGAMAAGFAGSQILSTPQDPWVIDAHGNTYMSSDGSTWSYLGTPTLVPGDRIVDIAVSIGAQGGDIFLVTNKGRTYYWVPGTSTSWTAGETNPIDVANYSEAVSMAFYQNSGAWLLTKNGSYFWLMDAHKSTKQWTYQNTLGVTGYTDLVYEGGTMYALRSGQNTGLNYSGNGNTFTSVTSPTGSTSNQTQFIFLPLTSGSSDDKLYVLCENGNIRHSSDGGSTWSALGNLPVPTGSNTSKYVALGIDPSGYMWVVTNTGYTFRSTDTTTFNQFTCMGKTPIGEIVAILPTTVVIPEFPQIVFPIVFVLGIILASRVRPRRRSPA